MLNQSITMHARVEICTVMCVFGHICINA